MAAEDRNERDYREVRGIGGLDGGAIDAYWRRVAETLKRVFGSSAADADGKVRVLREKVAGAEPDSQLHFYHVDPFQVAADLAGVIERPVTPEEKAAYVDLQELAEADRPDNASLRRLLPEDLLPRT